MPARCRVQPTKQERRVGEATNRMVVHGTGGNGTSAARRAPAHLVVAAVGIAVVVAIGCYGYYRSTTPDADRVRTAADNAAYELERTPIRGLGVYSYDVREALYQGNRGGRYGNVASYLQVEDVGRSGDTRYFEITNDDGDNPVCLAVTVTIHLLDSAPSFPGTSVTDGRCLIPSPSSSVTPSPSPSGSRVR